MNKVALLQATSSSSGTTSNNNPHNSLRIVGMFIHKKRSSSARLPLGDEGEACQSKKARTASLLSSQIKTYN